MPRFLRYLELSIPSEGDDYTAWIPARARGILGPGHSRAKFRNEVFWD